MLTAIIIDDEQLARDELGELLTEIGQLDIIATASNAIEGLKAINCHKPDVVFLDIHMPQISGMELLAMLDPETMPYVVFVTAYDQYAIQAFEENAFDYLLKPVEPKRLEKCIARLLKTHQLKQPIDLTPVTPSELTQVPCSGLNRIVIIALADIEYAYSDISGVHVQTADQSATCQLTLKVLEQKTPLLRCHRQYLINTQAIREIKLLENGLAEIVTQSDHCVPVSRRYLKSLKETLGFH
ncbi:two-component system response regulator BtsR [Vibrio sp. SCSIO 43136]|uniref:two-component system response regulator BtsR n=1 Tax=Vibrio sp. SCSIO 43136 TaxID=2819101 RepID=UPI002075D076|nr:two-component system response regulator BtsR [Vibrio sp. SCSIO 43136]USD64827.1 two-component system response regulator BtsR [Vibrio sp. SCSIO 43136]